MELESLKDGNYQYYHVIPDLVLCSEILSSNAKVLFTMISGLCNNTGYCWATNAYFSERLKWSSSTTKRALSELKNEKIIIIDLKINKDTKQVESRTITTIFRKKKSEVKSDLPSPSNMTHPQSKFDLDNSINKIKKYNNKPSASFSNFKKQKTILEMTFDEWLDSAKKEDKEHRFDETKSRKEGEKDYFLIMRQREFQRLQQEALNERKI